MKQSIIQISIIVPVYKTEKYLPKCIDSILNQSYTDFELILIDDGSPDQCGIICEEYAQKDNRIQVIHQPNEGVNSARKKGFIQSSGKWIMFVDSDDMLPPNALKSLINNAYGVDLVSGCALVQKHNLQESTCFPSHIQEVGEYVGKDYIYQLLIEQRLCSVWRQLIRKDILSEDILTLPRELKFSEDFIINFRIGLRIRKYRGIKDVVYIYRYYIGNTVTNFSISPQYIDLYDNILMQTIRNFPEIICDSLVLQYRSTWIVNNLLCPGIQSTKLLKTLNKEVIRSNISFRNKLAIIIANISNVRLRLIIWTFIKKCGGFIFLIKNRIWY